MSPWNDGALVAFKDQLKLNVSLQTGLGDKLEIAAGGFMNRTEARIALGKPDDMARMDEVIECLRKKGDKEFDVFLKLLKQTNNELWAEQLQKKAQEFQEAGALHTYGKQTFS